VKLVLLAILAILVLGIAACTLLQGAPPTHRGGVPTESCWPDAAPDAFCYRFPTPGPGDIPGAPRPTP
jgi:hypothetical protein